MMEPDKFFNLLIKELELQPEMQPYYKFLDNKSSWHFRKNYFLERLDYIQNQIINNKNVSIWDCGCGYGTTCLFLAMNGIKTYGTTLEFYYDTIQNRKDFWKNHGNVSLFTCTYENLFDEHPNPNSFDWIIVQDTLHHLEPINNALEIFNTVLKENGKVLVIEENGNNIIQRLKLFKYRGNNRIISVWDDKLQKNILLGNENIRSLKTWNELFVKNGFTINKNEVQYIRYYLPTIYKFSNADKLLIKERQIQKSSNFRKEYFFFGLNFIAQKNSSIVR